MTTTLFWMSLRLLQKAFLLPFRKPGLPLNVSTAEGNPLKAEKGGGGQVLPSQKLKQPVSTALEGTCENADSKHSPDCTENLKYDPVSKERVPRRRVPLGGGATLHYPETNTHKIGLTRK